MTTPHGDVEDGESAPTTASRASEGPENRAEQLVEGWLPEVGQTVRLRREREPLVACKLGMDGKLWARPVDPNVKYLVEAPVSEYVSA